MGIIFDRGNAGEAKGHALLYFRNSSDTNEIWATYLVILPVTVDISKYVPPFLMSQVGEMGSKDMSSFAFPPAPEKIDGYQFLQELAEMRDDDILFGGTINPSDVSTGMMSVNEGVQWYSGVYATNAIEGQLIESKSDDGDELLGVDEVLYGMMSDKDRLSELTKLVGKLRFAVEGGEDVLIREAEGDIQSLANHLPEDHQISRLIAATKAGSSGSAKLTDLLLKRCFHINQQEYVKLGQVEDEIKALESEESNL